MRIAVVTMLLVAGPALAQTANSPPSPYATNIAPSDTRSTISPNLPTPPLGENASPRDFLLAARQSLAAGRTGEAQQALEMAETRSLDRSVAPLQVNQPSDKPLVVQIAEARRSLATPDRARTLQLIDAALKTAGP